jgi:hypothetical protein
VTWLLRLYPRAWRARYEEEMRHMLAEEPRTVRLMVDLLAGAVDARLNPHWTPGREPSPRAIGGPMISKIVACEVPAMTRPGALRQAAWLIGAPASCLDVSYTAVIGRDRARGFSNSAAFVSCSSATAGASWAPPTTIPRDTPLPGQTPT